ncbi:MAG: hypothetical protein ACFHX7_08130 [Pseudomonadota bacterium]
MAPIFIFNATVLVFWAVVLVPRAIRNRNYLLYLSTAMLIFGCELWLALDGRTMFQNIAAGLFAIGLGTIGGVIQYLWDERSNKENLDKRTHD